VTLVHPPSPTPESPVRRLAIVGLHASFHDHLAQLGERYGFEPVGVLDYDRVRYAASYDIDDLLDEARTQLGDRDVHGVTSYWDFPSSALAAMLAEERGRPTPGLRAVAMFEHKYWSRLLQAEVAPSDTPPFAALDVHAEGHLDDPPLPYPFWLKPIKAYSSHLGFRIDGPDDLRHALDVLRRRIGRLGTPFQQVLERIPDLPADVVDVPGTWAIAEAIIDGRQCTVEGFVHAGEPAVHGVFDIHRDENRSTFTDYVYPSRLDDDVRERMRGIAVELMAAAGYDDAPFNIEFFWDRAADRTWILEVNPRISREHADLMRWVDDTSNLQVMARTALGEDPELERRAGPHALARKHFVRQRDDAVVERVPTDEELHELQERHAPCVIEVGVREGQRLSQKADQEPYSYELADLYLAGASEEEVERKRRAILQAIDLRLRPAETPAPSPTSSA
jgi:hypothetical protein